MKTEFAIDPIAFRRAARGRLLMRASFAAGLAAAFGLAARTWVPPERMTLAWSFVLTLFVVYAGVEVSALQWARRSTPAMRVRLGTHELECWIGSARYPLPYRELSITRVVARGGHIRRIDLKTVQGARVQLAGFADMDQLAESLTACLAAVRSGTGG